LLLASVCIERLYRIRNPVICPGNIYGEAQNSIDIEKHISRVYEWKKIVKDILCNISTTLANKKIPGSIFKPSTIIENINQKELHILNIV